METPMDRNPEPANGRQTPPKDRNLEKPSGSPGEPPPAGPHADPALTNPDATPGAGALTPAGGHDEADATSG
jgi:hypothetical protein